MGCTYSHVDPSLNLFHSNVTLVLPYPIKIRNQHSTPVPDTYGVRDDSCTGSFEICTETKNGYSKVIFSKILIINCQKEDN